MRDPLHIVLKPLLTEKNSARTEYRREYTFAVGLRANKIEIRQAIEKLYNVKVAAVRTMLKKGTQKRVGWRVTTRPDQKKAVVRLAEGYKIDLI
jgi:large subunit ribosomal protein L23